MVHLLFIFSWVLELEDLSHAQFRKGYYLGPSHPAKPKPACPDLAIAKLGLDLFRFGSGLGLDFETYLRLEFWTLGTKLIYKHVYIYVL